MSLAQSCCFLLCLPSLTVISVRAKTAIVARSVALFGEAV